MAVSKSIWESYEELPPWSRLEINLGALVIILCLIFWIDRWVKKRTATNQASSTTADNNHPASNLIKQEGNGVTYIYIARWRYSLPAMAFLVMLYVLITGTMSIIKDLPKGYWHHWNKDTRLVVIAAIGILAVIAAIAGVLRMGRKAVQMEIGKDYVRFRKSVGRGGIMFSDKYVTLNYSELRQIDFSQAPLIGYVLRLKTATETYAVNLILPPAEKVASYRLLDQATSKWQTKSQ